MLSSVSYGYKINKKYYFGGFILCSKYCLFFGKCNYFSFFADKVLSWALLRMRALCRAGLWPAAAKSHSALTAFQASQMRILNLNCLLQLLLPTAHLFFSLLIKQRKWTDDACRKTGNYFLLHYLLFAKQAVFAKRTPLSCEKTENKFDSSCLENHCYYVKIRK